MRGVHTYAILLGFAIGIASFLALRLGPLAIVVGIGATVLINEAIKKKVLEDQRKRQDRLDDDL